MIPEHIDENAVKQLRTLTVEAFETYLAYIDGAYDNPSTEQEWLEQLWTIAQRAALPYSMQSSLSAKRRAGR